MNRGVLQVAKRFVDGNNLQEGMLNRVEAVIRAFDPCLSCSTHDVGQMQMEIELLSPEGKVVDRLTRGEFGTWGRRFRLPHFRRSLSSCSGVLSRTKTNWSCS